MDKEQGKTGLKQTNTLYSTTSAVTEMNGMELRVKQSEGVKEGHGLETRLRGDVPVC